MFTKYRAIAKELALQRDRLHQHYRTLQIYVAKLFTYVFSNYELNCLLEYVDKQESLTLYANPSANDFYSHGEQAIASMSRNPFWLLYDLIKQEEKDGKAIV